MSSSFYLAHFSDPHFSISPNLRGYINAPGVTAKLRTRLAWFLLHAGNRRQFLGTHNANAAHALADHFADGFGGGVHPYDGFVVTGDLATVGTIEDLGIARKYFQGETVWDATDLKNIQYYKTFCFPPNATAILPGNHDRYDGLLCRPGGAQFEDVSTFKETWRLGSPSMGNAYEKVQSFNFTKNGENLTVLAADFSLRSETYRKNPFRYLGKGMIYNDILSSLEKKTKIESETSAVIWAVHFPPKFENLSRTLRLTGEDLLIDSAARLGIKYILAGHTHICSEYRAKAKETGNEVTVFCAGSPVCGKTEVPAFFDLEIEVDNTTVNISSTILSLKEFTNQLTSQKVLKFLA